MQGTKAKLPVKKPTNTELSADMFGNRLKLPEKIAKQIEADGFVHRFVSVKKMQESGGFHDKGWQIYQLKEGLTNPITGSVDKIYRVGDLVLAVKTKEDHSKHVAWLKQRADGQSQVVKQNTQEIRDKIKESKADKYVSIDEGYDEND